MTGEANHRDGEKRCSHHRLCLSKLAYRRQRWEHVVAAKLGMRRWEEKWRNPNWWMRDRIFFIEALWTLTHYTYYFNFFIYPRFGLLGSENLKTDTRTGPVQFICFLPEQNRWTKPNCNISTSSVRIWPGSRVEPDSCPPLRETQVIGMLDMKLP